MRHVSGYYIVLILWYLKPKWPDEKTSKCWSVPSSTLKYALKTFIILLKWFLLDNFSNKREYNVISCVEKASDRIRAIALCHFQGLIIWNWNSPIKKKRKKKSKHFAIIYQWKPLPICFNNEITLFQYSWFRLTLMLCTYVYHLHIYTEI